MAPRHQRETMGPGSFTRLNFAHRSPLDGSDQRRGALASCSSPTPAQPTHLPPAVYFPGHWVFLKTDIMCLEQMLEQI